MLGIEFIKGIVVQGNQKGRANGFPTANIILSEMEFKKSIATTGVFITKSKIHNLYNILRGISSISKMKDNRYLIETHFIDFNNPQYDFYNRDITIGFVEKIREQKTFTNKNDLLNQISKDYEDASNYLKNVKSCEDCNVCYQQDEGYSNYTVIDSNIGCFLNYFSEYDDSANLNWEINKLRAEKCPGFEEGGMWYLDVDGEEPGPTDSQIEIWKRNSKINQVINNENE
jgi:hypothetical protein